MSDASGPPIWTYEEIEYPAVYAHVTHSRAGEHFPVGEEMVVMFHDRAVVAEVTEVVTDDD